MGGGSCGKREAFSKRLRETAAVCGFPWTRQLPRPPEPQDRASAWALLSQRALVHAVALALHLDDVGVGEEAIEDRGGRGDVAEEDRPSPGWVDWW